MAYFDIVRGISFNIFMIEKNEMVRVKSFFLVKL